MQAEDGLSVVIAMMAMPCAVLASDGKSVVYHLARAPTPRYGVKIRSEKPGEPHRTQRPYAILSGVKECGVHDNIARVWVAIKICIACSHHSCNTVYISGFRLATPDREA